jgi:hypothetical protein
MGRHHHMGCTHIHRGSRRKSDLVPPPQSSTTSTPLVPAFIDIVFRACQVTAHPAEYFAAPARPRDATIDVPAMFLPSRAQRAFQIDFAEAFQNAPYATLTAHPESARNTRYRNSVVRWSGQRVIFRKAIFIRHRRLSDARLEACSRGGKPRGLIAAVVIDHIDPSQCRFARLRASGRRMVEGLNEFAGEFGEERRFSAV